MGVGGGLEKSNEVRWIFQISSVENCTDEFFYDKLRSDFDKVEIILNEP